MVSDDYVAGLLDGEGYITIVHRPRRERRQNEWQSYVQVAFTMCDRAPLDALAERFGGTVMPLKSYSERWRQPFRWQSGGVAADKLLHAVRGRVLVKDSQVELALAFRATLSQGGRRSPIREKLAQETLATRLAMRDQMRVLNRRGSRG